jgi:hypothetical protein
MVYMPLIHPTLAHDIKRLEAEFTHGYRPRALVFYVSICNEYREERSVKDKDISNWGPHWTSVNKKLKPSWLQTFTLCPLWSNVFYLQWKPLVQGVDRLHLEAA